MEFNTSDKRHRGTKVDLTPMVDLGFLLITFFMLATSLTKPKTLEVFKPGKGEQSPIPLSETATLLLGPGNKIYTYSLPDELEKPEDLLIDTMDYSPSGLRSYIQRRQNEVEQLWGNKSTLFVIIKPLQDASFKNLVDVLDEMLINDVNRYAIVEANTQVDSIIINLVHPN